MRLYWALKPQTLESCTPFKQEVVDLQDWVLVSESDILPTELTKVKACAVTTLPYNLQIDYEYKNQ